jgi:MOSC domain-containing protein YiiM
MRAHLVSVNVGRPQPIERRGRTTFTAIAKSPFAGRVAVRGVNVKGDDQADRVAHGGPDKAVYAYAREDAEWWARELDREIDPGAFGENMTTEGLSLTDALIGERWAVGTTLLEVCQPRFPCFKLGLRFGDPQMLKRFTRAERPGAYLRIVREGELGEGDAIEVLSRPSHGVTVALVSDAILRDESLRPAAGAAPELAEGLAKYLRRDQAA